MTGARDAAWSDDEPPSRPWRSGPWRLELRGDQLADVTFDGIPVARMLRAVGRDRDWDTVPSEATAVRESPGVLELDLLLRGLGADFTGILRVEATADRLAVDLELVARTAFDRNRLGLIVLHPPGLAGTPLVVTAPDGGETRTEFPRDISPHQPAFDIAALAWEAEGLAVRMSFEGEAFEMEDQRNWTDASYKTYSTPLSAPFPVHLPEGSVVRHRLEIAVRRTGEAPPPAPPAEVRLVPTDARVPALGVGASTAPDPLPPGRPDAAFVVVEPDARAANWRPALDRAAAEADGLPLDVRLVAGTPADVAPIVAALGELRDAGIPLARAGVFSSSTQVTEPELEAALVAALAEHGLEVERVGGARSHFTELNRRQRDIVAGLPAVAFASTPQMHATERAQVIESIPMQRLTAEQAVRIAAGRPVHVGPVTLRQRYNTVATTPPAPEPDDLATGYGPQRVDGATDARQEAPALAAWTIASAAAFAVPGVASIAMFETSGPRGVRDAEGREHPVAAALREVHALGGLPLLLAEDVPTGIGVLAAETPAGVVVLAGNLTAEARRVPVRAGELTGVLELAPFGAARLVLPRA